MLAASFWTIPHIVCLDEPTNYLDVETVRALSQALRKFKGGYLVVSHNQDFVDEISDEIWEVSDGNVASKLRNLRADESKTTESAQPTAKAVAKKNGKSG